MFSWPEPTLLITNNLSVPAVGEILRLPHSDNLCSTVPNMWDCKQLELLLCSRTHGHVEIVNPSWKQDISPGPPGRRVRQFVLMCPIQSEVNG